MARDTNAAESFVATSAATNIGPCTTADRDERTCKAGDVPSSGVTGQCLVELPKQNTAAMRAAKLTIGNALKRHIERTHRYGEDSREPPRALESLPATRNGLQLLGGGGSFLI